MADDKDGAVIFESRLPYSKSQGNSPTAGDVAQNGPFCRECGTDLLFSARARGNGLCGPCTRAADLAGVTRDIGLAIIARKAVAYDRLLADLERWAAKLDRPYPGDDAAATSATETSRSIAAAIRSRLEHERTAIASPGSSGEAGKAEDPCALVNTRLDSW